MLFACDDKTKSGSDCVGLELKNYKPRHTDMRRNLIVGMFRSLSFLSKIFLKQEKEKAIVIPASNMSVSAVSTSTEADLIGSYMTGTLTNGTPFEGTVFTYTPQSGILVLMLGANVQGTNPSLKVIRTNFIKDFKVEQNVEKIKRENQLPLSIDIYQQLPQLAKPAEMYRTVSKTLRAAQETRSKLLMDIPENVCIAAVDAFLHIARIFPQTQWDNAKNTIVVSKDVQVVGEPDWTKPHTIGTDAELKERIQKLMEQKRPTA